VNQDTLFPEEPDKILNINDNNINNTNIASPSNAYQVKLDAFEGPLDLLLHLIKKNKVDIYDIPIAEVTKQYMMVITSSKLKELDLDLAGEYLLMASTLAQIKSRMLLPQEEAEDDDIDDFIQDPREELVRKLLEYQKFKEAARELSTFPKFHEDTFPSGAKTSSVSIETEDEIDSEDINIFTLLSFFHDLVIKLPEEEPHQITEDRTTVSQKIIYVLETLGKHHSDQMSFSELFEIKTKAELIVTFLSILELTRLKYILIYQPIPEQEIWIRKNFNLDEIDMNFLSSIESSYLDDLNKPKQVEEESV